MSVQNVIGRPHLVPWGGIVRQAGEPLPQNTTCSLRIASPVLEPFLLECAFEDPPCKSCVDPLEPCGGFWYKFYVHVLGPMLACRIVFVKTKTLQAKPGNDSVYGLLTAGYADVSYPYATLAPDRDAMAKNVFPFFFSDYVAYVKFRETTPPTLLDGTSWMFLLAAVAFFGTTPIVRLLAKFVDQLGFPAKLSHLILKTTEGYGWLAISIGFAYAGSYLTLIYYEPPKPVAPFGSFKELAEGMIRGEYEVHVPYHITRMKLFENPGSSGILALLHKANLVNPVHWTPIEEAIEKVLNSERAVLVLTDEPDRIFVQQRHCAEILAIHPKPGELFMEMHGFYFGSSEAASRFELSWHQRHILADSFFAWMRYYSQVRNKKLNISNDCARLSNDVFEGDGQWELHKTDHQMPLGLAQLDAATWLLKLTGILGIIIVTNEVVWQKIRKKCFPKKD